MGGVTPGDGRLDLDDFEATADRAAALEVIAAGSDDRRWDRLSASPLGQRARRHRPALLGAGALCLVVIGTGVASEPLVLPPLDRELHVTTTAANVIDQAGERFVRGEGTEFIRTSSDGTHHGAYFLRPERPDDVGRYRIAGLVGPGVRASSTGPLEAGPGVVGATITVALDCWDPSALDQRGSGYALLVERTDEFGRTHVGPVSLPPSDGWPEFALATCLQERVGSDIELLGVEASPIPGSRSVRVGLDLRSGLPVGAAVSVSYQDTTSYEVESPVVALAGAGTAHLEAAFEVVDCTSPSRIEAGDATPDGESDAAPGLALDIGVPPTPDVRTVVHWSEADAARVDGVFAAVCADAPGVSVDVTATARRTEQLAYLKQVDATVVVESSGSAATIHAPEGEDQVRFATTTGRMSGGRAEIALPLQFVCDDMWSPPTVRLSVTTPDGTFPYLRTLNTPDLAAAVLRACGTTFLPEDMVANGWARPDEP